MKQRPCLAALGLGALLIPSSCGGGSGGGSSSAMVLEEAWNGVGRLLPYRTLALDATGNPTGEEIELRTMEDLIANVTIANPILPVEPWPATAKLPDGTAGNHFLMVRFRQAIDVDSVLDGSPSAAASSHLSGTITVVAINPGTGQTTQIPGRAFINGMTYGNVPDPDDPTKQQLQQWVGLSDGVVTALDVDGQTPGLGFPGTQSATPFPGSADLIGPDVFVFVPDSDGNLATHETFPVGVQIRAQITTGVLSTGGKALQDPAVASSTVGKDEVPPEVKVAGTGQTPVIVPGNGDFDVDPQTSITIDFTEPVQLPTIGDLPAGPPPSSSASIQVQFGPTTAVTTVPFTVLPRSVFDLSSVVLTPVYAFPGSGPSFPDCGLFNQVNVVINALQFTDLAPEPNLNSQSPSTFFTTGAGPGLINAPVAPDAIYVGRVEADTSISVVDLNGFGGGTGNPTYDPLCPNKEGNSNFPNNPNVNLQGSFMVPALTAGSCPFNGGSAGPMTLVKDSALDDRLVRAPIIESVSDMMLGHALDNVFNNGDPFGCQSAGGNLCAATGLKQISIGLGGQASIQPAGTIITPLKTLIGSENMVSWAPHPNPPPLVFPPLCISPSIGGQEPSSVVLLPNPPITPGLPNLLVPGPSPFGIPAACLPPQNLLSPEQNSFFVGPSPPAPLITGCLQYAVRQQIGQFLYVADRVASEVVVLNSNRMTVIDRIPLPDPTSFAMSPDLDFLAVTNENANSVSFLSIDPASSNFHQIVKTTLVGQGPTGIAWETGNEDIFVCNTADDSISIISAFTLNVRKTLTNQLFSPIDVVTTPRQFGFGLFRGVYFAYILNANGSVALFESGPDGVNGWGYDQIIGQPQFTFTNPRAIQADAVTLNSAVWIAHERQLDFDGSFTGLQGGAVTNMVLESGTIGVIPLDPGFFADPSLRDLNFAINASIGEETFGVTGIPSDIAFDNYRNLTAIDNFSTNFSAGFPLSVNGKSLVKPVGAAFRPVNTPQFLFVAVPTSSEGPGVIDVIFLEGGFQRFDANPYVTGVQSLRVPGVRMVMDYLRQ